MKLDYFINYTEIGNNIATQGYSLKSLYRYLETNSSEKLNFSA